MILLVGETEYQSKVKEYLFRIGYTEEKVVTNLVARAMMAPSRSDLQIWLMEKQAVTVDIEALMDKSTTVYSELVARIRTVDENTGGRWYMHDIRPLWFWEQFVGLASNVQVLAITSEQDNPYYIAIKNFLDRRLPKGGHVFTGIPTLGEFKKIIAGKQKVPALDELPTLDEIEEDAGKPKAVKK